MLQSIKLSLSAKGVPFAKQPIFILFDHFGSFSCDKTYPVPNKALKNGQFCPIIEYGVLDQFGKSGLAKGTPCEGSIFVYP